MILSKYPYVVQKEILDNMNYSELFLFSFASKNMKNLIKSSQINRFQSVNLIKYTCDHRGEPWVHVHYGNNIERIMIIAKHKEDKYGYFQLKVSGKIIDFRSHPRKYRNIRLRSIENSYYPYSVASYPPSEKESVVQSIHNYFLDFFGNSMEYQWEAKYLSDESFYIPFIPQLQNVSFHIIIRMDQNFPHLANLDNLFSLSPVLKSIKLSTASMEPINPESKFYQAESIEIKQLFYASPVNLHHFKGRQLSITGVGIREDLIEFVDRWKSGEAFQKLEYLKFKVFMNNPLHNGILNEIGAKYIDELKQPPAHTLPKVYHWYNERPNTKPIISHTYVVRETDNRVASILIGERTLYFGVWNETEEEFLEMVK
ncbi:unnamed protein product [Caenorhabditis nigoni]